MNHQLLCLAAMLVAMPLAAQQSVDPSLPPGVAPDGGSTFDPDVNGPGGPSSRYPSDQSQSLFDQLPGSSGGGVQQEQKSLDNQKNWMLLTPREIMGIPSDRAIFGLPESQDNQNLSATERYLKRINTEDQGGVATNAADAKQNKLLDTDPSHTKDTPQEGLFGSKINGGSTDIWGRKINSADTADEDPQRDAVWNSAFDHPAVSSKPNLQQEAEMARFQALLGSVQSEKPQEPSHALQPEKPVVDPNMQQLPVFNANGNTFTEVKDTSYQPNGIMPLPGIATRQQLTPKKPESITKLPPWLSHEMPSGPPQRVF
jgi:hypothetical protein